MNSILRTFFTVLLTAVVVGFGTHIYFNRSREMTVYESEDVTEPIEVLETQEENTIPSSSAANVVKNADLNFEFQLPTGYGALEDIEGEGTFQIRYYIGEFVPERGEEVIRSSLSVADYVKVIPSYDPEIVTLEDWREKGDVYDGSDASQTTTVDVAGLTATVSNIPGMGVTTLIQFVQEGNYYEIHTEGSLESEAIAKVIESFTFTK